MINRWLLTAILAFSLIGCVHVIPMAILKEVDRKVAFDELRKAPIAHKGKVVLLGGVLVKTVNKPSGTLFEIYQTAIDGEGRPVQTDRSGGRFLAFYRGFLDSAIYRRGRKVTIAGLVDDEKIMRLGELDYRYPYLIIKAIHLWRDEQPVVSKPYPWSYWDPWWGRPWYPWYSPYWRYRYRRH